jgi:protein N-terminal glutamine amidohydrolase
MAFRHQPFWCEENIWHLAGDPAIGPGERHALFITGQAGEVACWAQRAAPDPTIPVRWDYHVVLAVRLAPGDWQIWDLDSHLGHPLPATIWLTGTFRHQTRIPPSFRPRFALIPATDYRRDLYSDRSHMRTPTGDWQQPRPPWPAITNGTRSLTEYLATATLDLGGLIGRFAA